MLLFETLQLDLVCLVLCLPLQPTDPRCVLVLLARRQREVSRCTGRCIHNDRQSLELVAELKQTSRIRIHVGRRPISPRPGVFQRRPRSGTRHHRGIVKARQYVRIERRSDELGARRLTFRTFRLDIVQPEVAFLGVKAAAAAAARRASAPRRRRRIYRQTVLANEPATWLPTNPQYVHINNMPISSEW